MKNIISIAGLLTVIFLIPGTVTKAQQSLWFGTVKVNDTITQGRFEVTASLIKRIVYAPYGISPTTFSEVKHLNNQLSFGWKFDKSNYHCLLRKQDSATYNGTCSSESQQPIQLTIRNFSQEDAFLQGSSLHASKKDIDILERALILLNNGNNWNRFDNHVCDISESIKPGERNHW